MADVDIRTRVAKWLGDQGYPLEMRVASAFRRAGFEVAQSDYYVDPEERVSREIDVVATRQRVLGNVYMAVRFAIECKVSRDKPWVVFTTERPLSAPVRIVQRAASRLGHRALIGVRNDSDLAALDLFHVPDVSGYATTQAFTSGKDVCFAATTSVAKAAATLASNYPPALGAAVVFPLIVVDAPLVTARLDGSGKLEVDEADQATLVWRSQLTPGAAHTIIRLITADSIESHAASGLQDADQLLEKTSALLPDLYDELATAPNPTREPFTRRCRGTGLVLIPDEAPVS